jgi:hypothetical protein
MRKKTPRPTPGEDKVKAYLATLPVLEGDELRAVNRRKPRPVDPAQAEEIKRRRRQDQEEFKAYWARQRQEDRRRHTARRMTAAKTDAVQALNELVEGAMHPNRIENFSTARIAEVIVEAIAGLTEIAESTSPSAPRAREALQEVKRSLKRSEEAETKRRQRERSRGGKTPQQRSKMLTGLVAELVDDVTGAHAQGEREFAGVALPEWSFGFSRATDTAVIAVRDEWIKTMLTLVDDRVAPTMERLGAFNSDKWCDWQRDQARREVRKCWDRDVERRWRQHRDWVAEDMAS